MLGQSCQYSSAFLSKVTKPYPIQKSDIKFFQDSGFVTVRGMFSKEEVASIITVTESVVSQAWAPTEHYGNTFRSWRAITNQSVELASLACDPRLVTAPMQYLGKRIKLVGSQLIHRHSLDGTETIRTPNAPGWHRDIFSMDYDLLGGSPPCAVKAAVWLTPATKVCNGATVFVAGSHKQHGLPKIPRGQADPNSYVQTLPDVGDVTFFENRVAHAGGYNYSPQTLKILLFQYGYRWLQPVGGQSHTPKLLNLCSAFHRSLLQPIEIDAHNVYQPKNGLDAIENWYESGKVINI